VRDDSGEFDIGLDELLRFHDKDHYAGVVLAYKLLTLAFQELWSGEIPHARTSPFSPASIPRAHRQL
jgi:hypothetical protein